MNVGQLIGYLKEYDEGEEVEVEVCFGEVAEAWASTFDVVPYSHEEEAQGKPNPWPTIGVNVSFGVMAEDELDRLIEHVKGIDQRLRYYRDGA